MCAATFTTDPKALDTGPLSRAGQQAQDGDVTPPRDVAKDIGSERTGLAQGNDLLLTAEEVVIQSAGPCAPLQHRPAGSASVSGGRGVRWRCSMRRIGVVRCAARLVADWCGGVW